MLSVWLFGHVANVMWKMGYCAKVKKIAVYFDIHG
jgi:hypothetical protein